MDKSGAIGKALGSNGVGHKDSSGLSKEELLNEKLKKTPLFDFASMHPYALGQAAYRG